MFRRQDVRFSNSLASADAHPIEMLPNAAGAMPAPNPVTRGAFLGLPAEDVDTLLAFYGIANPHPQPATPEQVQLKRVLLGRYLGIRM